MSGPLPRGVTAVLRRLLPRDLFEPIAGDLIEDYRRARTRRGRMRTDLWVWGQAIRLAATFRWERLVHGRGVPPIAEELRRAATMWDALRQDVVFSARMLWRQPGFTVVALLALALGIGANSAIFSIVDAVLWRPLPYPRADRVMAVAEQRPRESRWFGAVAPADYFDWRRNNQSFSAMAAYMLLPAGGAYNLTGNGEPERVRPLEVSPAFLGVIGAAPAFGRDFRQEEETVGRHRVVLLSDGLWRRRFGADPSVVGRTIAFDGNTFEIIGVLPAHFWWPSHPDVVVPLALTDADRALRAAHFLDVVGRLRDDVSPAQALEDLRIIGVRLSQTYPAENANHAPNMRLLRDALVGDVRPALLVLLGAVAFVMLIACANVATLLLARAAGRQKELSVRRAVGATRSRVVQQMLTESLVVAFAGGVAGLFVAAWGLAAFRRIVPAQFAGLPGIADVAIDGRVLIATFGLSAVTGVIFGVVPALVASDNRIAITLNEETRGSGGSRRARRLRSALVVAEVALSLVLLAGAALLIVSFRNLINVSPGFQPAQLVITRVTLPAARYGEHARTVAFFDALYERLRGAPGVQRVAATTSLPFDGPDSRLNLTIEHRTGESPFPVRAHPRIVSTDYFSTMAIRLVRGRAFTDHDTESSGDVVAINEAAARRYWPNEDPLGQRISLGAPAEWREIVGVVGDTRHEGLDADADPAAFLPQRQRFSNLGAGFERTMTLVIRTGGDLAALTSYVRTSVAEVDPQLPIGLVRPMDEMIAESVAPRRLNFVLVSAFALVALVLTAAGLYGVMAYLVTQRTREIGVRMALGASRLQVLGLVLRQAGAMTLVGIAIGVAGALLLTRSMTLLLFGVSAADPLVYVGVSALLAAVALLAVAVPSSRATRIDPLVALRET
jgi:putative ABC transport system permease protein